MEYTAHADRVTRTIRQSGLTRTLYDMALRSLNRVLFLRVLKAVALASTSPAPKSIERGSEHSSGLLSRDLILSFAEDPQYEMDEDFLRGALAKNDRCYGTVDGRTLASYVWCSTKPTVALTDDLELRFHPRDVYMYKGFTHERYRGQRLIERGVALALQEYRAEGMRGIVCYVESNNFSSLKACYRMGYRDFGQMMVLRVARRYFIATSRGCRDRGFRLVPLVRAT